MGSTGHAFKTRDVENVRFYAEEESNDPEFAFQLIKGINATVFVNDGFR